MRRFEFGADVFALRHADQYVLFAPPGNDGVRPLQHHHSIPCFRIAQRHAFPIRIDLCRRAPGQPGHLAGVGR